MTAVSTREVIQLLGVGDGEDVPAFLAAQGDLRSVEALKDLEPGVAGNLGALLVELGTFAAPGAIVICGLRQGVYRYVEGVLVHTAEFDSILALADAVAAREAHSLESLSQFGGAIKGRTMGRLNWRLRMGLSLSLAARFLLVATVLGGRRISPNDLDFLVIFLFLLKV